jgi:hypothetical protein
MTDHRNPIVASLLSLWRCETVEDRRLQTAIRISLAILAFGFLHAHNPIRNSKDRTRSANGSTNGVYRYMWGVKYRRNGG